MIDLRSLIDRERHPDYHDDTRALGWRNDRLAEFSDLTDSDLHVLLDIVCEEGTARGLGSWWWE